ncbi:MAG: ester cyclase [Ignavibacteria bacterium]|nr:ester cyclase [Ignavibacteria bacterium]
MRKSFFLITPILLLFLSCQPTKEQVLTEEEATALLNRFMETVMNADTTLAAEMLHPDCVLRYPLLPEPIKGIDGYKAFIKSIPNIFSEFKAVIEEVNVKGNTVWCRYSMEAIHYGPLGDVPATGKKFQITGMAMTRLLDGKIIEDETFWNALSFYQQLGFTLSQPNVEIDY